MATRGKRNGAGEALLRIRTYLRRNCKDDTLEAPEKALAADAVTEGETNAPVANEDHKLTGHEENHAADMRRLQGVDGSTESITDLVSSDEEQPQSTAATQQIAHDLPASNILPAASVAEPSLQAPPTPRQMSVPISWATHWHREKNVIAWNRSKESSEVLENANNYYKQEYGFSFEEETKLHHTSDPGQFAKLRVDVVENFNKRSVNNRASFNFNFTLGDVY
jgi:hypothetical protein